MHLSDIKQLFSVRDIRNAAMGGVVVVGGLFLAGLTLVAHRTGQPRLAGIAAGLSLIFVLLILIFVVPPLARGASREASQLNLPFDLTLGGAIMLALIAIVGFSAWNTGNNLLFLVLSFLVASMLVGFVAGRLTLKKLDVRMRFPEMIFAGEKTPVYVSVANRKRLIASNSVVVEVRGTERERSIAADELDRMLPRLIAKRLAKPPIVTRTLDYFVRLPRNSSVESMSLHVFPRRGRFLIKDFEVTTKYPFSFFRHRRRLSAKETELVVLPKIDEQVPEPGRAPSGSGQMNLLRRGGGHELLALRDYHFNDDIRRIDWKSTAKVGDLIVREFSAEDEKKITILLDTRMREGRRSRLPLRRRLEAEQAGKHIHRSARFERAVSVAASLLAYFADQQAETRLIIGKNKGDFGIGSRHLYECLRRLSFVEAEYVEDPADIAGLPALDLIAKEPGSSQIYVVSASFTGQISPHPDLDVDILSV